MQIPVDVKAVLQEALDVDAARQTPISVSVYIDATAPDEVVAHTRSLFASAAVHARITITYLGGISMYINPADDMACIIAGKDSTVGNSAQQLRDAGIPVMIVTNSPKNVLEIAEAAGCPLPEADVISPIADIRGAQRIQDFAKDFVGRIAKRDDILPVEKVQTIDENGNATVDYQVVTEGRSTKLSGVEPYEMTDSAKEALNMRMGEWIIAACKAKKLSFALAFPFVRRPMALEAIYATSVQNAGVGAMLFIPGADMPVMTGNQLKMLLQIAAAYGQPMTVDRAKELLAVVGGGLMCRNVAREAAGVVPMLGWAIKGTVGYTGTLAMGRAAMEYFENGGGVSGVTGTVAKAAETAAPYASAAFEMGLSAMKSETAAQVRQAAGRVAGSVLSAAAKASAAAAASSSK